MTSPRPKRPNGTGSIHQFRHTVGGREYLRWRATGYFTPPDGKPKRLVGTGTTAAAAQEKLHQRIQQERVTYGLIGRDALDLPERSKKRLLSDVADEWLKDLQGERADGGGPVQTVFFSRCTVALRSRGEVDKTCRILTWDYCS